MTTTPTRNRPLFVTAAEAADILRVSRAQIYNLMATGQLRRLQVGETRSIRIPVVDIYALLGLDPSGTDGGAR